MILVKFNKDIVYHEVSFKRISEHVVKISGCSEKNTNGFKTYAENGTQLGDFSRYTTIYNIINDFDTLYSDNGEIYKEPEKPVIPQRELTQEEIKQMLIDGVQEHMDEMAKTRGYDNILSACSYINTGVERFDIEGEQARKWRSQVWAYCYEYLDEVLAGERQIPSLEELIYELPVIDWMTE